MDERNLYDKSYEIVKSAMKTVKHEIVITLEDDTAHIIYIHNIEIGDDGGISVDWSSLSEHRKDELWPHVMHCVKKMIYNISKSNSKKMFSF